MKQLTLSIIFSFITLYSIAQIEITFDCFDTVYVEKYKFEGIGINKSYFRTNYSDYEILNPSDIDNIKDKVIEEVELIYTDFPKGKDFLDLNKKRLASLYLLFPELFDKKIVKWTLVEQTDCSFSDVYNFFHGFVITYRPEPTLESISTEKNQIRSVVFGEEAPKDSTVLKILERNDDWKNMAIVCDFTGSMSPYVSQVILWYHLKIKEDKVKSFVFFNDGDRTPDYNKEIGKTGGIYDTDIKDIDSVINTAIKTISCGTGGDAPENDVEAILHGIQKFPEAENIILIADNKSDIRDTILIDKIEKPVKVILCGTENGVNVEYLNLALKTGGSIHTIEEDLENLIELNEGEEIKVGDSIFVIKNGKFVFSKKINEKYYNM